MKTKRKNEARCLCGAGTAKGAAPVKGWMVWDTGGEEKYVCPWCRRERQEGRTVDGGRNF